MPFSLHLNARISEVAAELQKAMNAPGDDLAPAALAIARVDYPLWTRSRTSRCSIAWAEWLRRAFVRPAPIRFARSTNICTTSKGS